MSYYNLKLRTNNKMCHQISCLLLNVLVLLYTALKHSVNKKVIF